MTSPSLLARDKEEKYRTAQWSCGPPLLSSSSSSPPRLRRNRVVNVFFVSSGARLPCVRRVRSAFLCRNACPRLIPTKSAAGFERRFAVFILRFDTDTLFRVSACNVPSQLKPTQISSNTSKAGKLRKTHADCRVSATHIKAGVLVQLRVISAARDYGWQSLHSCTHCVMVFFFLFPAHQREYLMLQFGSCRVNLPVVQQEAMASVGLCQCSENFHVQRPAGSDPDKGFSFFLRSAATWTFVPSNLKKGTMHSKRILVRQFSIYFLAAFMQWSSFSLIFSAYLNAVS